MQELFPERDRFFTPISDHSKKIARQLYNFRPLWIYEPSSCTYLHCSCGRNLVHSILNTRYRYWRVDTTQREQCDLLQHLNVVWKSSWNHRTIEIGIDAKRRYPSQCWLDERGGSATTDDNLSLTVVLPTTVNVQPFSVLLKIEHRLDFKFMCFEKGNHLNGDLCLLHVRIYAFTH